MDEKVLKFIPGIIAIVALLSCTASGKPGNSKTNPTVITMTTTTGMAKKELDDTGIDAGGGLMVSSRNIMENASSARDLTTLIAGLKLSGLVALLSGKGSYTVFAANNEAFNDLPDETVDHLFRPAGKQEFSNILRYHIVAGNYTSAELKDGMELKTLQGARVRIRHKGRDLWVNDARVVAPAAPGNNGTLWVINKVLLPG